MFADTSKNSELNTKKNGLYSTLCIQTKRIKVKIVHEGLLTIQLEVLK